MLSPEESKQLAELLFPSVSQTIEEAEALFPPRPESFVTRIAPSPTGFLHL